MNLYTISFILIIIFNVIKNKKSFHMLQQNLYNENNRYVKWMIKHYKSVFISLDFLSMIIMVIAYNLNDNLSQILVILAMIFYFLDTARILNNTKADKVKKELVITKRVKRLILTFTVLLLLPTVVYLADRDNGLLLLAIESILTYFSYILVLIAKFLNRPIEKIVYRYYETQAKEKLSEMKNLRVIGITGSYGKTSSKNILNDILKTKYLTRPTPRNLNTEYGLMMTVNNYLEKYDQVFIAEMGAYKQGEIKKLCRMVNPKYGILTNIGLAHLESFGSPEKIKETKFELIESLPDDGVAVLNMDDPNQVSYEIKNKCKKIWIGINNPDADIRATDIVSDANGSRFNVIIKGDKQKYSFETKLLGNYNIYNILAGIALGLEFNISMKDLINAVRKVRAPHARLELKQFNYMYQINDAYNSNPLGAKMALDVLATMPGKRIVVTPGMTELGPKEDELNHTFGIQIAKVADAVILVGAKKTRKVFDGLLENEYDKDKIFIVNNVFDAYNLLKTFKFEEDMYALFENDLPDIYNE